MLEFLGRGSAFTSEHNSAFFTEGDILFLVDCSMTIFQKLIQIGKDGFGPETIKQVYVILTHTHGDHSSGIPMLVHYCHFVWNVPITVGCPSEEVMKDMLYYFRNIEGCSDDLYTMVLSDTLKWVEKTILTTHVPSLEGKCFGYSLIIGGKRVVYTGDTNTLEPFIPSIEEADYLFTEASTIPSPVHLYLGDALDYLKGLVEKGTSVYLMHLSDEEAVLNMIKGTGIELAPLFNIST